MSNNLFFQKKFWPLFWTQFLGAFNDNVFKNAIVILITFKSLSVGTLGPNQLVTVASGVFILPYFLFSAVAGQISDKVSKNRLMLWTKIWELLVMLIGSIGFVTENLVLLLISLFFMGMHSTFFGPAKYSALPEILEREELVKGNALVDAGTFLSILLGTILGGVLIAIPEKGSYYVSATVIVVAIMGIITAMKLIKLPVLAPNIKIDWGFFKPTKEILTITKEVKSIYLSVLGISWFWFYGAAILTMFPIYVKEVVFANEQVVTLLLAIFSIGVAIGSILCEKFSHKRLELGLVPIGTIGIVLFTLDFALVDISVFANTAPNNLSSFLAQTNGIRILIDLLMLSIFSGFYIVPLYTFIQQRAEPEKCSRVIAGNNIINAIFMVASSIFLGALFALKVSLPHILLILALMNIVVGLYIYSVIPEFLLRLFCLLMTRLIYRAKIKGEHHIPHDGPALLICNHVSFIDWMVIAALVNRPVRFVMHYEFMKVPLLGWFFRGGKVIPIAGTKEDPKMLDEALRKIHAELKEGELVCVFPEGAITKDGLLNPFRSGVEKMAKEANVPVVPMALKGLWGTFTSRAYNGKAMSNPWIIRKTIFKRIELVVNEKIAANNVVASDLQSRVQKMLDEK
jgi:1-acyl-sn-glycerol-3-phosphate acyltransferase